MISEKARSLSLDLSKNFKIIYLAVPGLSCSMKGILVAACKLLAVACGISFPTWDQTWAPCIGSAES